MAKTNYSIPYPLDSTYLDMEIAIQTNSGIGARPFPIKNILLFLVGVVSCFFMVFRTPLARGTVGMRLIFVALWICLCALLLTTNRQKQLGLEKILSLITYFQPDNRFVSTRGNDMANNVIRVCGFDQIDDQGVIHYVDGSFGMIFDVIGNASILLFEDHKNAIIDRVDSHYRKMKPHVTYQFLTRKEPQKTDVQVDALNVKHRNITVHDAQLEAVFGTTNHILKDLVGQQFKSLHQYLIIQAPNMEELNLALNVFYSEVENSALMFKFYEQLTRDDIIALYTDMLGTRKEL